MSFSNTKRSVTADKSKEEFMKSIAQEVRIYNKNNEEFQRVGYRIVDDFQMWKFLCRLWNNFLSNKSNNV